MIDLKTKKILVTGGDGFVGKHLVSSLVTSRGVPREQISIPDINDCDLRIKDNAQRAISDNDIVIHLATITGGIGYHTEHPGEMFYDNLMMGVHVLEAARKSGVEKFIAIGSATEYPQGAPVPLREDSLWDGKPEESNLPYSIAKRMLLVQGRAYAKEYNLNVIHLLPTNMFGPGENPDSTFVIPTLIKRIRRAKAEGAKYIDVWGTGNATRDFLFVGDGVEGIIQATERYNKSYPVNLGSGIEVSIRELVNMLCRLMDFSGEIRWDATRPEGQPRRLLDISRAEHEFSFRPTTNFEDGLKRTIVDMTKRSLYDK